MYNESSILIYIKRYDELMDTYVPISPNMTWNATRITPFTLTLQLYFVEALNVSSSSKPDIAKVVILDNKYFYSVAQNRYLHTYSMSSPIRR